MEFIHLEFRLYKYNYHCFQKENCFEMSDIR